MLPKWQEPRRYRHFDVPISPAFAQKLVKPASVMRHAFSPLLHYSKLERRYKKCPITGVRNISEKQRPIKYASHRDACILAYYTDKLNTRLDAHYAATNISDSVIAYRALGRANYNFSAEALTFAQRRAPVTILAFDVTGFFDTLDHALLKRRLKSILKVQELPEDWYKVFRFITNFRYVDLDKLKKHPAFASRLKEGVRGRIASVAELTDNNVEFLRNPEIIKGNKRGIPQGTPISAAISNLYMIEFDAAARAYCDNIGALYRRYSDDILVICKQPDAAATEAEIMRLIQAEKLEIAPHKTEQTSFDTSVTLPRSGKAAQYLGFTLAEGGPAIRETSLARQWRKMKRAIRRAEKVGLARISDGRADKVFTKKLYRRFTHIKVDDGTSIRTLRNFSSYGRRSAEAFGADEKISNQVKRFERAALLKLAALKARQIAQRVSSHTNAAETPQTPP